MGKEDYEGVRVPVVMAKTKRAPAKEPVKQWRRVKEEDDWGRAVFTMGGKDFKPKQGATLEVMFPLGHFGNFIVKYKTEHRTVSDMGHASNVSSNVPYIEVEYFGLKLPVRLSTPGMKVRV